MVLIHHSGLSFLLGIGFAWIMRKVIPVSWFERALGSGHQSVPLAALAGALLPGCAMSSIPIATVLKERGAKVGTIATFLMIAPLISPHTIALTVGMLGWQYAMMRVILPMIFTIGFGWILNRWASDSVPLTPVTEVTPKKSCCSTEPTEPCHENHSPSFLKESILPLLPYYFGSLFLMALLQPFLTPEKIHEAGSFAYLVALLIGIPLYVCDGGEVPLTRSLLDLGVPPGPAFTFLLASTGTCFGTIAMAPRLIGRRNTILYVVGILILALIGGLLISQIARVP